MAADEFLLFVDSNKYLDLYRIHQGKKLLASLREQASHIFVTTQVVAEVERNKLAVASEFLAEKFKELRVQVLGVPDHLTGAEGADAGYRKKIARRMKYVGRAIEDINKQSRGLTSEILEKVSRSDDEVSRALAPIFANAVTHTSEELQRARDRRELGNPPGKSSNAIGDQLAWEQILTHFRGKRRLWVVSRDGDYGTKRGDTNLLNSFLLDELSRVAKNPEVFLFEDLAEAIGHFVKLTGVRAEQRLTPDEVQSIKKEEEALPPVPGPWEEVHRAAAALGHELIEQQLEELSRLRSGLAWQPSAEVSRVRRQLAEQQLEELRRVRRQLAEQQLKELSWARRQLVEQELEELSRARCQLEEQKVEELVRLTQAVAEQHLEEQRRVIRDLG